MSFSKELFKGIKEDLISPFAYSVTLMNGLTVYVDGFEKIISLSECEIVFSKKKQIFKIVGKQLKIEKMEEFSCVISGKIGGFYVE